MEGREIKRNQGEKTAKGSRKLTSAATQINSLSLLMLLQRCVVGPPFFSSRPSFLETNYLHFQPCQRLFSSPHHHCNTTTNIIQQQQRNKNDKKTERKTTTESLLFGMFCVFVCPSLQYRQEKKQKKNTFDIESV